MFTDMPCDYSKYPADWKQIRARILKREKHCCKFCGVDNHAAVRWTGECYEAAAGNMHCDAVGRGLYGYRASRLLTDNWNRLFGGPKWTVIVLTIAHLDHNTTNNQDSNLVALCQRCHLSYDKDLHRQNAKATWDKKLGIQKLF